jgi:hypothetical protein
LPANAAPPFGAHLCVMEATVTMRALLATSLPSSSRVRV